MATKIELDDDEVIIVRAGCDAALRQYGMQVFDLVTKLRAKLPPEKKE